MILRTENGSLYRIEQGTVLCFVMLCGITNIKIYRADHIICSVFIEKEGST